MYRLIIIIKSIVYFFYLTKKELIIKIITIYDYYLFQFMYVTHINKYLGNQFLIFFFKTHLIFHMCAYGAECVS
jgi:hypothetical protein